MNEIELSPIAPCGINCTSCLCFLRDENKCGGCRGDDRNKPKHCVKCSIKNCEYLPQTEPRSCSECSKSPCTRLKKLDKRYRAKYNFSILDNLYQIKDIGMSNFVELDKTKWICKHCGGNICMHRGYCLSCTSPQ